MMKKTSSFEKVLSHSRGQLVDEVGQDHPPRHLSVEPQPMNHLAESGGG